MNTIEVKEGSSIYEVVGERLEHFTKHGFESEHDDKHDDDQLAKAAAYFLDPHMYTVFNDWPWENPPYKGNKTRLEQLAVAGSLILAEMDRLKRL